MASEEDHTVFNEEELDDEDEDEDYGNLNHPPTAGITANLSQDGDVVVEDEEDDVDIDDNDIDDSTSSSILFAGHLSLNNRPPPRLTPSSTAGTGCAVTTALPAHYDRQTDGVIISATPNTVAVMEDKKPAPADESRRLFQRLWTDEDEIELLQGFLEYTSSRGAINSSHHHDTAAFYDQVKSKFQLDFNKNQLVEKLRRLKKKYRTVMSKISSGKDYVFKSSHEQVTFELSRKIWSTSCGRTSIRGVGVVAEECGFDEEDANRNCSPTFIDQCPNINPSPNLNLRPNLNLNGIDMNSFDRQTPPPSRKRSRARGAKIEGKHLEYNNVRFEKVQLVAPLQLQNAPNAVPVNMVSPTAATAPAGAATEPLTGSVGVENPLVGTQADAAGSGSGSGTSVVEETVKSCLSPIFKELFCNVINSNGQMSGSRGYGFGYAFSPMPLGMNGDLMTDEKWRKQQILELEVYSKRLELVQDNIKIQLEELRSMNS